MTPAALAAFAPMAAPPEPTHPMTLALAFAFVGFFPVLFMSVTAFVKISTVLYIARSALGAPEVPSGAILFALSVALTLVAMAPVGEKIEARVTPLLGSLERQETASTFAELGRAIREPITDFLRDNASSKNRERFSALLRKKTPAADASDLRVLVPAFLVTELMEAFLLGFAIYLPFLVVDLVVANVLAALGMLALPADRVSLPLKLLLFVTADGWGTVAQALVTGYKT